jgi:beta-galactosidase/beta-glucuronidase
MPSQDLARGFTGTTANVPMHPRPQLRRDGWISLDGEWKFAVDELGEFTDPAQVTFTDVIVVPFAPEAPASGIGRAAPFRACWYQRSVTMPAAAGGAWWLNFGAVDYRTTVWVNGAPVAHHDGGYTPFAVRLAPGVADPAPLDIVVHAEDDPSDLCKPRGKQAWSPQPNGIWYPRTTGIWQTVWLEHRPTTWIDRLRWTPTLERWEVGLAVWLDGVERHGWELALDLSAGDTVLARDRYAVVAGEVHRRIALSDPGVDDFRNALLWSPESPTLLSARLTLMDGDGRSVDVVDSYAALRSVAVDGGRFLLNNRPYPLRLVLDQGYWPDTGMTPPDDAALERDVRLTKAMGFNGVRKHQKIEDPRFLALADRLGLLVWEEMPSAYRFTGRSVQRVVQEWMAAVSRDVSHPCIVAWVPFNESWGVPNLPHSPAERHYVRAMYELTRTLDPTRVVVGNDGWESLATDIIGIHDYGPPAQIRVRYGATESLASMFTRERPGGRALMLEGLEQANRAVMLTECGGIAFRDASQSTWGYTQVNGPEALADAYLTLMRAIHEASLLSGFCYTQLTDTYQEANGLLTVDRTPKLPIEWIAACTRGEFDLLPNDRQAT